MAARTPYSRVGILGGATATTLQGSLGASGTSFTIGSGEQSSWSGLTTNGRALIVIDRDGSHEEKLWVSNVSGATVTIADTADRGADGTTAQSHDAGEPVEVIIGAVHLDENNKAVSELLGKATTAGQMLYVSAAQVYTALAIGAAGTVAISSGTAPTWQALSGDVTVNSSGVTAVGSSKVLTAMLNDGSVTAAKLAAAVAGSGLAGGAGTALSVNVDGTGIEINSDTLRLKDSGVVTAKLNDDAVTLAKLAASAKPRWAVGPFSLSASDISTNTQLHQFYIHSLGIYSGPVPYLASEAGAIIGLSVSSGNPRDAGSMTFEVYKNNSGTGFTATINGSNLQYAYATQAETADTFAAGDRIDVRATSSSYAPTSSGNGFQATVLLQAV